MEKAELDRLVDITKAEPKGVAVYARVSTKNQQDAGNFRQKKDCWPIVQRTKIVETVREECHV